AEHEAYRDEHPAAVGDQKLRASAPDVEKREGPLGRSARAGEPPGGAEERQPRFLLAGDDAGGDAWLPLETGQELAPVPSVADGGGGDHEHRVSAQAPGPVPVVADGG